MIRKSNKVLGRGLEALISDNKVQTNNKSELLELEINKIIPNENQPRKNLDNIEELAESIKTYGVIQPVIVLNLGEKYQIIAGERRWRAAKLVGLKKVPVIIKESLSSKDKLEIALIENLQRQNLNIIEEANAYRELIENFSLTNEKLSQVIGKDRTTIINIIRLLSLPKEVQEDLKNGILQQGHVRPLINIQNKSVILKLKERIIKNNLSVRQVEKLVNSLNSDNKKQKNIKKLNTHLMNVIEKMQEKLSTKVGIIGDLKKGKIIIEYYTQDDLDRIMEIIDI